MAYGKAFRTEGLRLSQVFGEVPNKTKGMSNILSAASTSKDYLYEDISILNGIATYGLAASNNQVSYNSIREENRLSGIELENTYLVQLSQGIYQKAQPIQTINNQLATLDVELGEELLGGGGDGLLAEYYGWKDVYGNNQDIQAESGGTYVENQGAGLTIPYFSPNTAVVPSDSEAFFDFGPSFLAGKEPNYKEKIWDSGIFKYENGNFHPSVNSDSGEGIIKFSGYFNTGFGNYGDARSGNTNEFHIDRFIITQQSNRFGDETDLAGRTSVPVIIKLWEVNQKTGERTSSDDSPIAIGRYAPGQNSPEFDSPEGQNPPMYYFTSNVAGGINNNLIRPDDYPSKDVTQMDEVGSGFVVMPITDSSPKHEENTGVARNKYSQIFKNDTFYSMEMYFILAPRNTTILKPEIFIEGYDYYNRQAKVLQKRNFFSSNPLAPGRIKGKINDILLQTIDKSGTRVSGLSKRIGLTDSNSTPNFKTHYNSIGYESPLLGAYSRIFSDSKIQVNYKAPHNWPQIARARWVARNFATQRDQPPTTDNPGKFHYTVYNMSKGGNASFGKASDGTLVNNERVRTGNLIIDANSPKPKRNSSDHLGSVFAPFTYIDHMIDNYNEEPVYLSKPVTSLKTHESGLTTCQAVDHRGLKGYGCGRIELVPNAGADGGLGMALVAPPYGTNTSNRNMNCPRTFYDGEPLSIGDIIIFEDYNDTPFIKVHDVSPQGAFFTCLASTSYPSVSGDPTTINNKVIAGGHTNAGLITKKLRPDSGNGRNFFIYRHKGLVDESLDGFCTLDSTSQRVIEGIAISDATTSTNKIILDRKKLLTYDGQLMREPSSVGNPYSASAPGILGLFADYNGDTVPNESIINKVFDLKLPRTITINSLTHNLDQYSYLSPTGHEWFYAGSGSIYGNKATGDFFYSKDGLNNSPDRLIYNNTQNRWEYIEGGALVAHYDTGSKKVLPDTGNTTVSDNTYALTYTSTSSPNAGVEIHLYNSDKTIQNLVSDIKTGFGVTITDTAFGAQKRYQCFPPTNTAPPFLATTTGLASRPGGETGLFTDSRGSIEVSLSSPRAGATGTGVGANDSPCTITCSQIKLEGGFGNNSPGINSSPGTSNGELIVAAATSFARPNKLFQPGGVIELASNTPHYNKRIEFNYITPNGDTVEYFLLGTTDPTI